MNDFSYEYAIQMPNGELLKQPVQQSMFDLLGFGDREEKPRLPMIWLARDAAEAALEELRKQLADKGIEYRAIVVQALRTPFTIVDPAESFADEVQQWLEAR